MNFDSGLFTGGANSFLNGLFGHPEKSYDKAMEQYQNWANRGEETQQPYLNAGQQAIGNYQNWLGGQQNPSQFINSLLDQYNESPYNQYLQNQSMRAGENAASASGLMGSTPFLQQQQQNAANIGQQGMQDWLKNVLGINTQYGQGQQNLMTGGQNSANALTNLFNNMGTKMGEAAYGSEAGKNQSLQNLIGGGLGIFGSFL